MVVTFCCQSHWKTQPAVQADSYKNQGQEAVKVEPAARSVKIIQGSGCLFVVASDTGEILADVMLPGVECKRLKKQYPHRSGYVGKDTTWPSEARDADELVEATKAYDWWPDSLSIRYDSILDLLDSGIGSKAVQTFRFLAQHLTGRNHWFGTLAELAEGLNMQRRTLERALEELELQRLISRKAQGKHWPLRISLHPWYAWKGDFSGRDHALQQWVKAEPPDLAVNLGCSPVSTDPVKSC
jgi:DNA-binding transcriptional ArsR family regulator